MNLTTRRISEINLDNLIKDKSCDLFSCKVTDKFGDMGLVGVVSFKIKSNTIEVIDFILSCRAFGRSIEKSMLLKIIQILNKKKADKIIFKYLKTKKNKPCLDFLKSNLLTEKKNIFHQSGMLLSARNIQVLSRVNGALLLVNLSWKRRGSGQGESMFGDVGCGGGGNGWRWLEAGRTEKE